MDKREHLGIKNNLSILYLKFIYTELIFLSQILG